MREVLGGKSLNVRRCKGRDSKCGEEEFLCGGSIMWVVFRGEEELFGYWEEVLVLVE